PSGGSNSVRRGPDAATLARAMQPLPRAFERLRDRVRQAATRPFSHAPSPLEHTLAYDGDPGLFGPDSATWAIIGDVASFLGGVRALLVQAAHPEVVAGVVDHSAYQEDPLGRLSRTSAYVAATAFGAMPEVERAVDIVRRAHRTVAGTSHRGRPYAASMPPLAAWVHNALTDSFLTAYRTFGPRSCSQSEADRFVSEQTRLGRMLGGDPLPEDAAGLAAWLVGCPDAGASPGMRQTLAFLRAPPLHGSVRLGYAVLFHGAVATLPPRIRKILGLRRAPGALLAARLLIASMRWAMGSSPAWQLALQRCHAPIPPARFRAPAPP
ncbi:MAG TPA: oxygenase MpaB family protein, partial [Myxococcota bacterium]